MRAVVLGLSSLVEAEVGKEGVRGGREGSIVDVVVIFDGLLVVVGVCVVRGECVTLSHRDYLLDM